ncbi:MAG: 3D-(3,5/4)-trihydroxycyclohexane-1,2-dione acylhydrolase (decyclizing) [Pseudomonadota bacterium]
MTKTIRLTAAQALVRYCANQMIEIDGKQVSYLAGCWGIFGHGNVAGLGEALYQHRDELPTYRGHNEQSMAHAAIAYAKASVRRRAMMVTTSIGPGATNLVTAAALAHVNRLPVLLVPGDVFANRAPDPVLQQVEDFVDGTVSANDCFRPVSRYFDRITRPEQLLLALPRAFQVMTDPANCGPVTLAFCQDVQAEAFDYPEDFFAQRLLRIRRAPPAQAELDEAIAALANATSPMIIAGGGVHYSIACDTLRAFAEAHNIPVAETQAGKSALAWDHPMNVGPIGVTGASSANAVAAKADVVLAVGTRMQDFTTGSWSLFKHPDVRFIGMNAQTYDGSKRGAMPLVADAKTGLELLNVALGDLKFDSDVAGLKSQWFADADTVTAKPEDETNHLPTDMQVVGAVQRACRENTVILGAAGTMPGEMHKLYKAGAPGSYHMEYGFSCMGYELAGALGAKLARPESDVIAMVGDGSYMMMNSELASAVMMGVGFTVVITDNRGFGCINRLQMGTGGANFNNLLDDSVHEVPSHIDFVAHAASMGCHAVKADSISALEEALDTVRGNGKVNVIVIDTDPLPSTEAGGSWWDVAVPEVSPRAEVKAARDAYEAGMRDERTVQ